MHVTVSFKRWDAGPDRSQVPISLVFCGRETLRAPSQNTLLSPLLCPTPKVTVHLTASAMSEQAAKTQRAVRWYPPAYDIRVEDVPVPKSAAQRVESSRSS